MDIALAALAALVAGVAVGFAIRKTMAARDTHSAESRAKQLVTEAEAQAQETVRTTLAEEEVT